MTKIRDFLTKIIPAEMRENEKYIDELISDYPTFLKLSGINLTNNLTELAEILHEEALDKLTTIGFTNIGIPTNKDLIALANFFKNPISNVQNFHFTATTNANPLFQNKNFSILLQNFLSKPNVESLIVEGIDLTGELKNLVENIKNTELVELTLNTIGLPSDDEIKTIAEFIGSPSCNIKDFVFARNGLDADKLSLLADGLKNNNSIEKLGLSNNPLEDKGIAILLQALTDNIVIDSLILHSTNLQLKNEIIGEALTNFCQHNSSIKSLIIDYAPVNNQSGLTTSIFPIESSDKTNFLEKIFSLKNLTSLNLVYTKLNNDDITLLCSFLRNKKISNIQCDLEQLNLDKQNELLNAIEESKIFTSFGIILKNINAAQRTFYKKICEKTKQNSEKLEAITFKLEEFTKSKELIIKKELSWLKTFIENKEIIAVEELQKFIEDKKLTNLFELKELIRGKNSITTEEVATFIQSEESNIMEKLFHYYSYFKLVQRYNKYEVELQHENMKILDAYLKDNYFTIGKVSKNELGNLSILPSEIIDKILGHIDYELPELSKNDIELAGVINTNANANLGLDCS